MSDEEQRVRAILAMVVCAIEESPHEIVRALVTKQSLHDSYEVWSFDNGILATIEPVAVVKLTINGEEYGVYIRGPGRRHDPRADRKRVTEYNSIRYAEETERMANEHERDTEPRVHVYNQDAAYPAALEGEIRKRETLPAPELDPDEVDYYDEGGEG